METEQISQDLSKNVKKIAPLGKKLKFKLDNDFFLFDGTSEINLISGKNLDANCTITMSKETYGKLQPTHLFKKKYTMPILHHFSLPSIHNLSPKILCMHRIIVKLFLRNL